MLYFNQFRKFSPTKVPKYSIDKVIVCVHAHEPLGMQILARTLDARLAKVILMHKRQVVQCRLAFNVTIQRQLHREMRRLPVVVHSCHCSGREAMQR